MAGSPPRVWGMRFPVEDCNKSLRFTPTGVGNAQLNRELAALAAVHPHGCGECLSLTIPLVDSSGSPPRVWGMHMAASGGNWPSRFTPTGVGNARATCESAESAAGSPPRVWGMPHQYPSHGRSRRFTPTGVGNADTIGNTGLVHTVHPHGCGECFGSGGI